MTELISGGSRASTRDADSLLAEAMNLIDGSGPFNREKEAKVNQLLRMVELVRAGQTNSIMRYASDAEHWHAARISERNIDPAVLEFFGGMRSQSDKPRRISTAGGRIDELMWVPGVGAISELRDFSGVLPQTRAYGGLAENVGTTGGDLVPTGYIPQVFAALKRTDQILDAADWETAATATGNPINIPSLNDTSISAVVVSELSGAPAANPAIGPLQFGAATTWSSQIILASLQLAQDARPMLASVLADAFRVRFARGFGAHVVSVVTAAATVGATMGSAGQPTQFDLLDLMGSLDAQYASADTAGWCMSWGTLVYILQNVNTNTVAGDAMYHAKTDGRGHYLLFGKPVFVSNSMPSLSLSSAPSTPVLFGDFSRLIIRNVPSEAVIRRYDELYMPNNQKGYEMLFRADAAIMVAGGAGSGDSPIVALAA